MSQFPITDHAYQRAKERIGLKPRSLERMLSRIHQYGITPFHAKGALFCYMMARAEDSASTSGNQPIIYGNHMYLFSNHTLITVYPLPKEMTRLVSRKRCLCPKGYSKCNHNRQKYHDAVRPPASKARKRYEA